MLIKETIYFLGVRVDSLSLRAAVSKVKGFIDSAENRTVTKKVFFTNVHSIHLANRDPELYRCILNADLVLPDGSGLNIAGKVLKKPVKENLNGTDFTPVICRMAESLGYSVYLLGAKPEVIEKCRSNLKNEFPSLRVAGAHHGYFDQEEENNLIDDINRKRPDILLVAMGSPLQEKWITKNAHRLNTGVCFAVGGLFDFLSGEMDRAPLWMRKMGIEWMHRFAQNPGDKWNQIFVEIPAFLYLVMMRRLFQTNFYRS